MNWPELLSKPSAPVATVILFAGVALALFLLFVVGRLLLEGLLWLFRWRQPLLADHLGEHLAVVRPPRTLGDRMDRAFDRVVSLSLLGLNGAQGAASILLVGVFAGVGTYLLQPSEVMAACAAVLAMAILAVVFTLFHRNWRASVQDQLPDTFHLLARSLRAGLTVEQSFALIGEQGPQPIAREFRRCADSLRLGTTVPAALELTRNKLNLPDFDLLVAIVGLHREKGGNLALLADRLGDAVRSRNHSRGQALAATALGRLTGVVLACVPPVLLGAYWVLQPEYFNKLLTNPQGVNALLVALALEVVGVVWLAWLLRE